jgi:hypothetical protein
MSETHCANSGAVSRAIFIRSKTHDPLVIFEVRGAGSRRTNDQRQGPGYRNAYPGACFRNTLVRETAGSGEGSSRTGKAAASRSGMLAFGKQLRGGEVPMVSFGASMAS